MSDMDTTFCIEQEYLAKLQMDIEPIAEYNTNQDDEEYAENDTPSLPYDGEDEEKEDDNDEPEMYIDDLEIDEDVEADTSEDPHVAMDPYNGEEEKEYDDDEPEEEEKDIYSFIPIVEEEVLVDVIDIYSDKVESDDFSQQNITISLEEIKDDPPVQQIEPILHIPKIIFIVPYRNRPIQLEAFNTHMKHILEDYPKDDYVIYYIHQKDKRIFNRGAIKNIGFLVVKNKYPNDYKNITLVFNDVDTMPVRKNMFHYDTIQGVVKHFFGFTFTLGGIVSIKAGDFELVNGFPNFWAWGYEDNLLQIRLELVGIKIDRTTFYKLGDKNIIQHNDEMTREVNQGEYERYIRKTAEGIYSIKDLKYDIEPETGFVHVHWFTTDNNPNINQYRLHDLKEGPRPYDTKFGLMFNNRRMRGGQMKMIL